MSGGGWTARICTKRELSLFVKEEEDSKTQRTENLPDCVSEKSGTGTVAGFAALW